MKVSKKNVDELYRLSKKFWEADDDTKDAILWKIGTKELNACKKLSAETNNQIDWTIFSKLVDALVKTKSTKKTIYKIFGLIGIEVVEEP